MNKRPDCVVVHVITSLRKGGAENHLLSLATGQASEGIRCIVVSLNQRKDDELEYKFRKGGVEVHSIGPSRGLFGIVGTFCRLRRILNRVEPDIVHSHLPRAELLCALLRFFSAGTFGSEGPRLVATKHNDAPFCYRYRCPIIARFVAAQNEHVIAISSAVRAYITDKEGQYAESNVSRVYYGIDTRRFSEVANDKVHRLRRSYSVEHDSYIVGTVSRLVGQKDVGTLIKAYSWYRENLAEQSSCLWIVGDGPERNKLRKLAEKEGVADYVVWFGRRSDIPVLMNALDLFVLTSVHEGLGLVLLEAMAAKRAVVATHAGAIPEIVVDGRTGLLVKLGEPKAVATLIARFEDVEARRRFGRRGYYRVRQEFSRESMVSATNEVYRKVVTNGNGDH